MIGTIAALLTGTEDDDGKVELHRILDGVVRSAVVLEEGLPDVDDIAVVEHLGDLLQEPIGNLLIFAWDKLREVEEAREKSLAMPITPQHVRLAGHSVSIDMEPIIEASTAATGDSFGIVVARFTLKIGLDLDAAALEFRAGRVASAALGSARATIKLSAGDVTLHKRTTSSFAVGPMVDLLPAISDYAVAVEQVPTIESATTSDVVEESEVVEGGPADPPPPPEPDAPETGPPDPSAPETPPPPKPSNPATPPPPKPSNPATPPPPKPSNLATPPPPGPSASPPPPNPQPPPPKPPT
ncbi:MAG: hypothetical protein AAGA90_03205 [Actinomycetota bacterium]